MKSRVVLVDAFVEHVLEAALRHRAAGLVGEALAVGGLVVDDRDALALEALRDDRAGERALLVVAAADAEHVPHAALGDLRIGGGRRDHQHAVLLVDVGGRDGDAGIEVADHELHAVGHELVGGRHAFARIGAIVADGELDFLPENAALGIDVGDRLLDALPQLRAEGGGAAGHRTADAHPDLRRGGTGQHKAQAQRKAQRQ